MMRWQVTVGPVLLVASAYPYWAQSTPPEPVRQLSTDASERARRGAKENDAVAALDVPIYDLAFDGDGNLIRPDLFLATAERYQMMVEIEDAKIGAAEGSIALQIHSGGGIKVLWRNINIKEL